MSLMVGLIADCKKYFNTEDLYEVLQVESNKEASATQIRKAYYRQSIRYHPDKATQDDVKEEATAKFQILTQAYSILSDKSKRSLYDETGTIDEENVLVDEESINVWRQVFKKVTIEDIEKFCASYKGTEDEKKDVISSYERWKGNMEQIMNDIMGTNFEDESRIKKIIDELIANGTLESYPKYRSSTSKAKSSARRKKCEKEAKEAESELAEIKKKEGTDDLAALILKRQSDRAGNQDAFLDSLASKYAPKKKVKKTN